MSERNVFVVGLDARNRGIVDSIRYPQVLSFFITGIRLAFLSLFRKSCSS